LLLLLALSIFRFIRSMVARVHVHVLIICSLTMVLLEWVTYCVRELGPEVVNTLGPRS
jgi:hypothetical protein